jgi:hypothetical protein
MTREIFDSAVTLVLCGQSLLNDDEQRSGIFEAVLTFGGIENRVN